MHSDVRMPSSEGSGNSGDELEWPLLLWEEARIDVRCQTLQAQMPAWVTQARDVVRDVDLDIRQPTVAHVQPDVGAMTKDRLILLRARTCDERRQDSGDSVTDVVVPQTAEATFPMGVDSISIGPDGKEGDP